MNRIGVWYFIIFGLGFTVFMFIMHSAFSPYDMNPLDFFECTFSIPVTLPFLFVNNDEF